MGPGTGDSRIRYMIHLVCVSFVHPLFKLPVSLSMKEGGLQSLSIPYHVVRPECPSGLIPVSEPLLAQDKQPVLLAVRNSSGMGHAPPVCSLTCPVLTGHRTLGWCSTEEVWWRTLPSQTLLSHCLLQGSCSPHNLSPLSALGIGVLALAHSA